LFSEPALGASREAVKFLNAFAISPGHNPATIIILSDMKNAFPFAALATSLVLLAGCQASQQGDPASAQSGLQQPASVSPTQSPALVAVANHVKMLPNAAVYQLDSATVADGELTWQVMVPRTDWAGRMPNASAFEVDKQTRKVTTLMVK
jgi:hypothetical protein